MKKWKFQKIKPVFFSKPILTTLLYILNDHFSVAKHGIDIIFVYFSLNWQKKNSLSNKFKKYQRWDLMEKSFQHKNGNNLDLIYFSELCKVNYHKAFSLSGLHHLSFRNMASYPNF